MEIYLYLQFSVQWTTHEQNGVVLFVIYLMASYPTSQYEILIKIIFIKFLQQIFLIGPNGCFARFSTSVISKLHRRCNLSKLNPQCAYATYMLE